MVENLDWNIGRLLQALEHCGKAQQTCIVFTSDNGGLATAEGSPTCNAPLSEGKGWVYEGGVREPLIVSWPGVVEPGSVSKATVTSPDFYPTLLEVAGAEPRPGQACDGTSFMPALRGEAFERGPVFWYYPHYSNQGGEPAAAVRDGPWKLVRFYDGGGQSLYNLAEDISERHDVANEEPGTVKALAAQLDEWCAALGATPPAPNPFPVFPDVPGDNGS
jgi:arylsulfatase A-like enzyme